MQILLDTHALLWYASADAKLSSTAKQAIDEAGTTSLFSAACLWEMSIKFGIGKLTLGESVSSFWHRHEAGNGVILLPINALEAMMAGGNLPMHHRDPFDRLLISQSVAYQLPIVSADDILDQYGVNRIW